MEIFNINILQVKIILIYDYDYALLEANKYEYFLPINMKVVNKHPSLSVCLSVCSRSRLIIGAFGSIG